jgi:hypothetical protein
VYCSRTDQEYFGAAEVFSLLRRKITSKYLEFLVPPSLQENFLEFTIEDSDNKQAVNQKFRLLNKRKREEKGSPEAKRQKIYSGLLTGKITTNLEYHHINIKKEFIE